MRKKNTAVLVKPIEKAPLKEAKTEPPVAPDFFDEPKGNKPKKNKNYPLLPERELRRQLRVLEKRAMYRAKILINGIMALTFAILALVYYSWFSVFALLLGLAGITATIIGVIKFKKKIIIFVIIGLLLNVAAIGISLIPLIGIIPQFGQIITIIQETLAQLM